MKKFLAWVTRYWQISLAACIAVGLLVAKLMQNWRASKEADWRHAARAAEIAEKVALSKASAARHEHEREEAEVRADLAREAAVTYEAKAKQAAIAVEAARARKNAIVESGKAMADAESIDAWARRLGY